jgi:hypothetical protein
MASLHRVPAILLAVALLAAAALPMAAPAEPLPAPGPSPALAEAAAEDEEESEEECVVVEEEFVDGELQEFCAEEDESEAASSIDNCFLRSAHAHSATKHNKLKVTVGYTTNDPADAKIEIRQGGARIGTFSRHLGKSGVLRFTSKLNKRHRAGVSIRIRPTQETGCPARRLVLRAS